MIAPLDRLIPGTIVRRGTSPLPWRIRHISNGLILLDPVGDGRYTKASVPVDQADRLHIVEVAQ